MATTYDAFSLQPEYIEANRGFVSALPLDNVRAAIDLACGTGLISRLLLERKAGLRLVGVDLSAPDLDLARREQAAALATTNRDPAGRVRFVRGRVDALPFAAPEFDLAVIGNAIHMLPDPGGFLDGIRRILRGPKLFAFNSAFFVGTYCPGTEGIYGEWLREAFVVMKEKDAALRRAGKEGIKRERKKGARRAFDNPWLTPEEWRRLLAVRGFEVLSTNRRTVMITRAGLEAIGAYGGFAEVLMSGYPTPVAGQCLQEAARRTFSDPEFTGIPRYWLEIVCRTA